MRRIAAIPFLLAFLGLMAAVPIGPSLAQDTAAEGVWVVTIPRAFPGQVFTWNVAADGTYREDARARNGARMQNTVSGKWNLTGVHLVFRQDDEAYVFDGTVAGGCYIGRLSLEGKDLSPFTARKRGSSGTRSCDGDTTI
ncbi:MAG TPA: hypothetical protein VJ798_11355 [Rhizomicrobium sp.]|nr:hypothetical protein [Rhizomicrobium sp.]